jgi:hypothetical protein
VPIRGGQLQQASRSLPRRPGRSTADLFTPREWPDGVEGWTKVVTLEFEVVPRLQVDPEAFTCAEEPCEPKCSVRADPALAVDDLVDPARRNADRDRQTVLGDPERLQEVRE